MQTKNKQHYNGAYPAHFIKRLMQTGAISHADPKNIQPSSLDLSISDEIYKMKGIFLPRKNEAIRDLLKIGVLYQTDLEKPLECGGIYLVRLNEKLSLPKEVYAHSNNKSSSGRVNLQARLIADGVCHFDSIPQGYKGELWLLITPQSFSIKLYPGNSINQMRFLVGNPILHLNDYKKHFENDPILFKLDGSPIALEDSYLQPDGISMTVDIASRPIVGYKCSQTRGNVLDFNRHDHDPLEFFEPIYKPSKGYLVLQRNEFYILCTREAIRISKKFAVEMAAYDTSKGEFRSHYAGFFDPGWGVCEDENIHGWPGVLEIMTNDNDFILRDGQPICKMTYQYLIEPAEFSYGSQQAGSHYRSQAGPRLSKHFKLN